MELTERHVKQKAGWERMKSRVRQGFRKAAAAAAFVALPLLASPMGGCGAMARPMDDGGSDARATDAGPDAADAGRDSSPDATVPDSAGDADVPTCIEVERPGIVVESEQELSPERGFGGYDCNEEDGLSLEYDGHQFDVVSVDDSTAALGWNGSTIEVGVTYPDGSYETAILSCNAGDVFNVNDELYIWSPWAMEDEGRSCAQLHFYHEVPITAVMRETVDRVVSEGDPSCEGVVSETLRSLEVQLPSEPWLVGPDDTYTMHSLLSNNWTSMDLGVFGSGHIISRRDGDGFNLMDSVAVSILNEGESHEMNHSGISMVTADEIYIPAWPRASIRAHVTFYDDLGEVAHEQSMGQYYSYLPRGGYIRLNGTSDGPVDLALDVVSMRTAHEFVEGQLIEAGGATWEVRIGPNDAGVPRTSLTLTRVETE